MKRPPHPGFTRTLVNRLEFPTKCILVCEDFLDQQAGIAAHFAELFPPQGTVEVCYVSGAIPAAAILEKMQVDLILLDRDMPSGGGDELLAWMDSYGCDVPVLCFSGIPGNNDALMSLGADYYVGVKADIIAGAADDLIRAILAEGAA